MSDRTATTSLGAPIRVLIADDQSAFLQGLGVVLSIDGGIEVVAVAENGEDAIARAVELVPDVVLLDVRMPGMGGIEAARAINQQVPIAKIIMLTAADEGDDLAEAVEAGASGYLIKEISVQAVADAIHAVARGQSLINPSIASKLLTGHRTSREREILTLIATGMSRREIADELAITETTVENHVRNILEKLHREQR